MKIVLGSSSPFRKQLLEKLHIDFECCKPDIDESPKINEKPSQLVERLSSSKAIAVANHYSNALIIGSDQIAVFNELILGKPGTHRKAVEQLASFSEQQVQFITGLCLYNSKTRQLQYYQDITRVTFRKLNQSKIENYLNQEQPYQCTGSFKSEGLGIALFKSIESTDPNALIGLPVIKLVEMLNNEGIDILDC